MTHEDAQIHRRGSIWGAVPSEHLDNPEAVLAQCARRGVVLAAEGDRLSWRAPAGAVTADLIEAMKTHKGAILAGLVEPDAMARQRYGRPPDHEIQPAALKPSVSDRDADLLMAWVGRQPARVLSWIVCQADRYDAAHPEWQPPVVREYAAVLDVLLWQFEPLASVPAPDRASRWDRVQAAIKVLRGIQEAKAYFAEPQPPTAEKGSTSL